MLWAVQRPVKLSVSLGDPERHSSLVKWSSRLEVELFKWASSLEGKKNQIIKFCHHP